MKNEDKINALEILKKDLINQFTLIANYQKLLPENIYTMDVNLERLFTWFMDFYKYNNQKDNTSKKMVVLAMVNFLSSINVPMNPDLCSGFQGESPIEHLLFQALNDTMPSKIWEKAYLQPQLSICGGKYIIDIALMSRNDSTEDNDSSIIIGIECDGHDYHYKNKETVLKTLQRRRYIEMLLGISVFNYHGSEIFADARGLANDFWKYVSNHIFINDN